MKQQHIRPLTLAAILISCLSACGKQPVDADATSVSAEAPSAGTTTHTPVASAPAASDIHDHEGKPVSVLPFNIQNLEVSNAPLGALPFFSLPPGYESSKPHVREWARFPVRIGNGLHWVAGHTWSSGLGVGSDSGKEFSPLELQRNLENLITAAGGSKVFEGPMQRAMYYGPEIEDEIGSGFIEVVNRSDGTDSVYLIRQAQRNIWVQLSMENTQAGLVVIDEVPFEPTAKWADSFPYLSMPAGYNDRNHPKSRDFDRFPFWVGDHFEQVEGRAWQADFGKEEDTYSMAEVRRNLEAMMASVNGEQVFQGRVPKQQADAVPDAVKSTYSTGAGNAWDEHDVSIYRVNLPDGRQVWVHARMDSATAGWVVVERKGFMQSATLLPAADLKKQLDRKGKVSLQVNFATDKVEILKDSQPQIDQVVQLLKEDPSLKLAVNGHTDNSGDHTHNQILSEGRAASVVAALTRKGIDASRLRAAGFGDSQPVADNGSEDGKAKNRRVELVKR